MVETPITVKCLNVKQEALFMSPYCYLLNPESILKLHTDRAERELVFFVLYFCIYYSSLTRTLTSPFVKRYNKLDPCYVSIVSPRQQSKLDGKQMETFKLKDLFTQRFLSFIHPHVVLKLNYFSFSKLA